MLSRRLATWSLLLAALVAMAVLGAPAQAQAQTRTITFVNQSLTDFGSGTASGTIVYDIDTNAVVDADIRVSSGTDQGNEPISEASFTEADIASTASNFVRFRNQDNRGLFVFAYANFETRGASERFQIVEGRCIGDACDGIFGRVGNVVFGSITGIDRVLPVPFVSFPSDGQTFEQNPVFISGRSLPVTNIQVTIDGRRHGTTRSNGGGDFQYVAFGLADGLHTVSVRAEQNSILSAPSAPLSFRVGRADTTPPVTPPTTGAIPDQGSTVNTQEPRFCGEGAEADTDVTVYVNGSRYGRSRVNPGGSWCASRELPENGKADDSLLALGALLPLGSNTWYAVFTDAAGNESAPTSPITFNIALLSITQTAVPNGAVASAYNQTLTATGGTAPYVFTLDSGAMPAGLTLSIGGVLSGTPTAGGTFNFTVRATDSTSQSATQAYSLTVATPAVSATASVPAGRRGFAYSQTLTGSGGTGPYTFALNSGALPAGIILSSTGVLSGTPTVVGSFPIGVRVTDSSTGTGPYSGTVNLTLVVNAAAIAVTPTSLPSVIAGLPYQQTLSATGGAGAYSYAITAGALPTGIIVIPNGSGAGRVVGNSYSVGTFAFTVTATDAFGNSGSVALSIAVTARPDPSLDPEVRGLNSAQEEATRRLASAQIRNFTDRLDRLRQGRADDGAMNIRVTSALADGWQGGPSAGLSQRFGLAGGAETADPLRSEVAALRFAPMGLDMGDRIGGSGGPVSGFGGLGLASTAIGSGDAASTAPSNGGAQASAPSGGIRLWTGGAIAVGTRSATSDQARLSISSQGLSAGLDFAVNDRLDLGVGVGYGAEDTEVGTRDSTADTTSVVGVVYASFRPTDGVYLDAMLGQGSLSFDLTRRVTVDNSLVFGERDGDMRFGSISLGFDRVLASGRWSAYGRIDAMSADLDGYTETGSPFWALNYDAREVDSLQGVLGLRYAASRVDRDRTWRPTARAEWRQELGDGSEQTLRYADFLTGPSYQIGSTGWDRGLLDVGVGLGIDTAGGWTADVELGAQLQQNQSLGTVRLLLSRRF